MTTTVDDRAKDLARFMQTYSKKYAAGAFATPTSKEIANPDGGFKITEHTTPDGRVIYASRVLSRPSKRYDFTGRPYLIPAGANIITHLARDRAAQIPDLGEFDAVFTYTEDLGLANQLREQDRHPLFQRVTAASELITCWGRAEYPTLYYAPHDLATTVLLGRPEEVLPMSWRERVLADVRAVTQWDDDFPYYSDGSWSAVSLRGFYPGDPRKGVKPSEMPREWKQTHPGDLARTCEWTTLAAHTPGVKDLVGELATKYGWNGLERVRLLRMGTGKLGRHTDITDKAAGLADGQIARFHIPLITHPDIRMTVWDLDGTHQAHHLPEGSLWYLDARKPHAVHNPTPVDRVHLVIDVVSDANVRALIGGAA